MAEIKTSPGNAVKGVRRTKKLSTRVDLTPMVDLGFLLITFFMITITLREPKALNLLMPVDGPYTNLGESGSLTILPTKGNRIFYYHGDLKTALQKRVYGISNYSIDDGIGEIIRNKQIAMDNLREGSRKDLMLIIKPTTGATYRNVVDLIDEVLINDIPRYALTEPSEEEKQMLTSRKIDL